MATKSGVGTGSFSGVKVTQGKKSSSSGSSSSGSSSSSSSSSDDSSTIGKKSGTYTSSDGTTYTVTEGTKSGGAPQEITRETGGGAVKKVTDGVYVSSGGKLIQTRVQPSLKDEYLKAHPEMQTGTGVYRGGALVVAPGRAGEYRAGQYVRDVRSGRATLDYGTPQQWTRDRASAVSAISAEQQKARNEQIRKEEQAKANFQDKNGKVYSVFYTPSNDDNNRTSSRRDSTISNSDNNLPIRKIFTKEGIKTYGKRIVSDISSPIKGALKIGVNKLEEDYKKPIDIGYKIAQKNLGVTSKNPFVSKIPSEMLRDKDVQAAGISAAIAPIGIVAPTATAIGAASLGAYQFYKNPTVEQAASSTLMIAPIAVKGVGKTVEFGKVVSNKGIVPLQSIPEGEISLAARGKLSYTGVGQEVNAPIAPRFVTISRFSEMPKDFFFRKLYGESSTKVVNVGEDTFVTRSFGDVNNPRLRYVSKVSKGSDIETVSVYRGGKLVNTFTKPAERFDMLSSMDFTERVTVNKPLRVTNPDKSIVTQSISQERLLSYKKPVGEYTLTGDLGVGTESRAVSFSDRAPFSVDVTPIKRTFVETSTGATSKTTNIGGSKKLMRGTTKVNLKVSDSTLKNEFTQSINRVIDEQKPTISYGRNKITAVEQKGAYAGVVNKPLIKTQGQQTVSAAGSFRYAKQGASVSVSEPKRLSFGSAFDTVVKNVKSSVKTSDANAGVIKSQYVSEQYASVSSLKSTKVTEFSFSVPKATTAKASSSVRLFSEAPIVSEEVLEPTITSVVNTTPISSEVIDSFSGNTVSSSVSESVNEPKLPEPVVESKRPLIIQVKSKDLKRDYGRIEKKKELLKISNIAKSGVSSRAVAGASLNSSSRFRSRTNSMTRSNTSISRSVSPALRNEPLSKTSNISKSIYASKLNSVQRVSKLNSIAYPTQRSRFSFGTGTKIASFTNFVPPFEKMKGSLKREFIDPLKVSKSERAYTPSLYAIAGNIKGKRSKAGEFTGLGVRPIDVSKRKKYGGVF